MRGGVTWGSKWAGVGWAGDTSFPPSRARGFLGKTERPLGESCMDPVWGQFVIRDTNAETGQSNSPMILLVQLTQEW